MQKKKKLTRDEKFELKVKREQEQEKLVLDNWQTSSELGKLKFSMKFGVMSWGLPTFAIYSIIMIIVNMFSKTGIIYGWVQALIAFVFFIIFGMFYGSSLWKKNEKLFRSKYPYGRRSTK